MQAPVESRLTAKAGGRCPGDKGILVHCVNVAVGHAIFLVTIHCNSVGYFLLALRSYLWLHILSEGRGRVLRLCGHGLKNACRHRMLHACNLGVFIGCLTLYNEFQPQGWRNTEI
jgi:hypothetical protein